MRRLPTSLKIAAALCLAAHGGPAAAQFFPVGLLQSASSSIPGPICTDGAVSAAAMSATTLYIGGNFSQVGTCGGGGAPFDSSNGYLTVPAASLARIDGTVSAVTPDGAGGWFVGGSFSRVGAATRVNLARINADGSLNAWSPPAMTGGTVSALAFDGTKLYVGGSFSGFNQAISYGSPLDPGTGEPPLATLASVAGGAVNASVPDGAGGYFIGGDFTTVGGVARQRLAHVLADGSLDLTWDPGADASVKALYYDGTTLYAGGDFIYAGGLVRPGAAAFDGTTGAVKSWTAKTSGVSAITGDGTNIYIGGSFQVVGAYVGSRGAALDTSTGQPNASFPVVNGGISAVAPDGAGGWYIGGAFSKVGGLSRSNIAQINSDGSVSSWNPSANSNVFTLAVSGSTVYVGGNFSAIGGQSRNRIAALDATTGLATSWNPSVNNSVYTLVVSGSAVYVGGNFTATGGQSRGSIAALDATTGLATSWNPSASGQVTALAVSGSTVYAGGQFTSIGGQSRNYIAALDATTGLATSWNPNANSNVNILAISGSMIYAGGSFSTIGGYARTNGALLDTTTGLAQ